MGQPRLMCGALLIPGAKMSKDVDLDEVIDRDFDDRGGFESQKSRRIVGLKAFVFILLLFVLGLVAFVIIQTIRNSNEEVTPDTIGQNEVSVPNYRFPLSPPAQEEPQPEPVVIATPEPEPVAEQEPTTRSWTLPPEEEADDDELTPQQRVMARSLRGFSSSASAPAQTAAGDGGGMLGQAASDAGNASSEFSDRLSSNEPTRIRASMLENPSLTIPAGSTIACGNVTELDTTVPGQVSCQVSYDVFGADNQVKLIDKGAQVTGLVEGGISRGQARVFVAWQRARNPDHVTIQLDSAGAGPLGAPGVGGQVNNYFWERFGNAMAVSVFGDASNAAFSHLTDQSSSDNQINLNTTSNTVDQLAQEVLRANMDIPPTLSANQAQPVIIYVSNDLDFSDVYSLEVK